MRLLVWTEMFLGLGLALLIAGCGKPASPPPAAPAVEPRVETPQPRATQDTAPKPSNTPQPTAEGEKPTVLKAVGRALFKSFTSGSEAKKPPEAPSFRPRQPKAP